MLRGGIGSLFLSYLYFHHPEEDEAALGREEAFYTGPGPAPALRLMTRRDNVTKFTGERLGGDEGCPSDAFLVDWGQQGEGFLLYKRGGRLSGAVCGSAVQCIVGVR